MTLAEQLIGKGMQLSIYDPEVHLSQLLGANRSFIEQHLPHIDNMLEKRIDNVIGASDLLVVSLSGVEDSTSLASLCRPDQVLLDLVGLPNRSAIRAQVQGLCWQ